MMLFMTGSSQPERERLRRSVGIRLAEIPRLQLYWLATKWGVSRSVAVERLIHEQLERMHVEPTPKEPT